MTHFSNIGQECGPLFRYTRPKGIITSPQYPIQYRPRQKCKWIIEVIPGSEVILTVHSIDMPAQMDCRYGDYLLVSGKQDGKVIDFGVYCGTKSFKPFRITGEYDEIFLTFSSNGKVQGQGFNLTYEQVELSSVGGTSSGEVLTNGAGPELSVPVKT